MKSVSVKKLYKKWSKLYDVTFNPATAMEGDKPIKALGNIKGKKIFDVGCGTGRDSIELAKRGANVTGVDFSKEMLDIAKKKANKNKVKVNFIKMDILKKIKFPSNYFDGILCNLVFNHIKNPLSILKDMKRILKKEGVLVITDMHPYVGLCWPSYDKLKYFYITKEKKIKSERYTHNIKKCMICLKN